ncbi:hypothetical protein SAMN04488100_11453 [Alkalibacterium putridalgicola]|uniref:Hemerythrin n=1 Tax=Alkalibacterium putridalgicola TaxID=426703 RepID=A0A1H7TWU5_9LACT|nr:DUF438 domain-containing protein [Alkalibacterium putridalgicola]GEK88581.1 hemerythrin [Alkalibacterium putridalgicola]SEL89133.1 hypothetical protein SAMN04488100_11453 [Alkalibacterium putridalgicola]
MKKPEYMNENQQKRVTVLKDILLRLHGGADSESVQAEFDEHFQGISAIEISLMEHELIDSEDNDITFEDVMKLCNVHANLFKNRVSEPGKVSEFEKPGHPIQIMRTENQAMRAAVMRINRIIANLGELPYEKGLLRGLNNQLDLLAQFDTHYKRKEEVWFPVMEKYGHDAPPKVMWGVDDQIRELFDQVQRDLGAIDQVGKKKLQKSFETFSFEFNEMIFKEETILVPLVLDIFNEDDWIGIAKDSKEYGYTIVKPAEEWVPERVSFIEEDSDSEEKEEIAIEDVPRHKEMPFGNGFLTLNEVEKILDILPLELTFINKDNVFKYFNDSIPDEEKVFRRAPSAIGREVKNCHPPKSLDMVLGLIADLSSGRKDKESMWFPRKNGQFIHVTYAAVRDDDGTYMGILEYVQDIQPLRDLTGMKRGLSEQDAE